MMSLRSLAVYGRITGAILGVAGSGAQAAPTISATPSLLSFSYSVGAAPPPSQTVRITSSGAILNFAATTRTLSGGGWLSVSPAKGITPGALSVSVTPAVLAPGTYLGAINLTSSGVGSATQNFAVLLTVNAAGAPALSANGVVNASGHQNKLAPGALFEISGSGLGPDIAATASAPDYPTLLGGVSVTFTPAEGGDAVQARMKSAAAGQVSGLLPSSVAPGTYAVSVTHDGQTSQPQNVTVVPRSFGIATLNKAGTGPAQATIVNVNDGASLVRFTSGSVDLNGQSWTLTPAHPGDTLQLSGAGGGADLAGDLGGTSGDQTADGNFIVSVGGRRIVPSYAGADPGSPGLWRITFTLPSDITPDCYAVVQVSADEELSNVVSIPIAAEGEDVCADPQSNRSVLTKLDAGEDVIAATFAVTKLTATAPAISTESGSGGIYRFTASEWILSRSVPRFEYCTVYDRTYTRGAKDPADPDRSLDAGSRLTLSGPNLPSGAALGSRSTTSGPVYLFLPTGGTIRGGVHSLTGSSGSQVGPFNASTTFPASFTVTNWDSVTSIDRATPLTFNWTGSAFDRVSILVSTATLVGSNQRVITLSCLVPGNLSSYSVPTAALAYLEPAAVSGASVGTVSVQAASAPGTFTAPLTGGGQTDIGVLAASLGVAKYISVR